MLYHQNNFIMVHVPKTAGTSVEEIFGFKYYDENEKPNPKRFDFEIEKYNQKLTTSHPKHFRFIDYENLLSEQIMIRYFKFSFIRNPWDLVVSKFEYGKNTNIVSWEFLKDLGKTKEEITFEEYIEGTKNYFDMDYDYWLIGKKYSLDYIGKLENINEDWAYICGRCQMNKIDLPVINKNKKRKRNYQDYYNSKTKDYIYNKYEKWIKEFKYEF